MAASVAVHCAEHVLYERVKTRSSADVDFRRQLDEREVRRGRGVEKHSERAAGVDEQARVKGQPERDAWFSHMQAAVAASPATAADKEALIAYFQTAATSLINRFPERGTQGASLGVIT